MKDRKVWAVAAALVIAAVVSFGPVLRNGFINFDDFDYIIKNEHVREFLTLKGLAWAFGTSYSANWHPVTWLSHQLDVKLFRLAPWGHHLTSLLIHAANSLLLFSCLLMLTGRLWPAALVAALFTLHPLHVESVAWVAERKDVLSAFFAFLTLLAWAAYLRRPGRPRYLAVLLLYALGLMSKPMVVTLPLLMLLLDWWPLGRLLPPTGDPAAGWLSRRTLLEKVPLLFLSAASGAITWIVQSKDGATRMVGPLSLPVRLGNALVAYAAYLKKMVLPMGLAYYYPHPGVMPPLLDLGASLLILCGVTALVIVFMKRCPALLSGWSWYLLSLLPVIGIVQVGAQSMADRYTYLPLIGVFLMAAYCVPPRLLRYPLSRAALGMAVAILLAVLMALTRTQVGYWRDSFIMNSRALEVTTGNWMAHYSFGLLFEDQGRKEEAYQQFLEAVRLNPKHWPAREYVGKHLMEQGRYAESLAQFREALRINPNLPQAAYHIGIIIFQQGHLDEAAEQFRSVLKMDPKFIEAEYNLAMCFYFKGRLDEARQSYRRVLTLRPEYSRIDGILRNVFPDEAARAGETAPAP